jgi:LEA14-like dessication related protein
MRRALLAASISIIFAGCATLEGLRAFVQPPRFEQDRPAQITLGGVSRDQPLGGANLRLWLRVTNPNPFGFTLSTLDTTLLLDGRRAATGAFPLGLPLGASQQSVVPIDLQIDFTDVPGLVDVVRTATRGDAISYELEGTIGVDAGRLGEPTFGPMSLVRGSVGSGL